MPRALTTPTKRTRKTKKTVDSSLISSEFKVNTNSKFGWCLTGHHKTCIKTSVNKDVCSCECHR